MPATIELDRACAEAVDLARAAAVRRAGVFEVGEYRGASADDTRVATHYFACDHPAYPGWQWAVVSGDEWYKAAYHQPAGQGGDTDDYWLYPTSSNSAPSAAQANYLPAGINNTTPAGSYAPNFYGTYDMAGNVYEWNDSLPIPGPFRGYFWGGAFDNIAGWLTPLNGILSFPASEREQFGFRVVQIPAPSATALLALGGAWAVRRRRA